MSATPFVRELMKEVVEELEKCRVNRWYDIVNEPPNSNENVCILVMFYTMGGDILFTLCDYHPYYHCWKSRDNTIGCVSKGWWMSVGNFPVKYGITEFYNK